MAEDGAKGAKGSVEDDNGGERPVAILDRHIDKQGLRNQQVFLVMIGGLMLVSGILAAKNFGVGSLYTIMALGGGVCFLLFALFYSIAVARKLKNTRYVIFENRIEYQKDDTTIQVIPLSEVTEIQEERTQWQRSAGLTSVVLNVRPQSYLAEEEGIAYFILADVPIDDQPSDTVYAAMKTYRKLIEPQKNR